ncbi:MAG: hypothetical protein IPO26_19240 [Saprospiraceae bacterium]|nr:hypothetical protein [Saprospiraceae bacterium]
MRTIVALQQYDNHSNRSIMFIGMFRRQTITLTNGACEYQLPNLVTGAGVCDFFTIEQVSGPEPGDLLPRGSYDITYQLVSNLERSSTSVHLQW